MKFHLNRFLRRVRIHGGEFDTSARAMYRDEVVYPLQAELRIVRRSTIERKQMSTKTTFKRIALVTVAALGFGVLSVVPSSAAPTGVTITVGTGSSTLAGGASDSITAPSVNLAAVIGAGDSITVQIITKSVPSGGSTDARFINMDSATATNTTQKLYQSPTAVKTSTTAWPVNETATGGFVIGSAAATNVNWNFKVQLESATAGRIAGTYVFTLIAQTYESGTATPKETLAKDVTITIAAATVVVPVPDAGKATAYLQQGDGPTFTGVLTDSVTAGVMTAGITAGEIQVSNFTSLGAVASDTITVKMTGVGYLVTAAGTTGREFTVLNEDVLLMDVKSDGSSGTGTITITTEKGAKFVKTVSFYDNKPSKAVATVAKAYIKAGTGSVADVFSVVVTDAAGTPITSGLTSLTAAPTDTATTVGGAATCSTTYDATDNVYYCAVKGLSTLKFGPVAYTIKATGSDAAKTVVSSSATVTFADNVATKAVLAGPASGAPGAAVEYTITLTEKNGYPVADEIYGAGVEATGGDLFSKAVVSGWTTAPFAATESWTSVSGVITSKGTLPLAGTATGTWTLVGDGLQTLAGDAIDKTIGKTTITATTVVANAAADAATAATAAAEAATAASEAAEAAAQDATDAALDATTAAEAAGALAQEAVDAVAELSAEVTKLMAGVKAQITYLTKLVMRLAAK